MRLLTAACATFLKSASVGVEDKTGAGATFCGAVIFKAGLMDLLTDVDGEEHADTAGLATVVLTGTVFAAAGLAAMGADATGAGTTLSGLGVSFFTFFAIIFDDRKMQILIRR
jgi:hypothetical protein